MTVKIEIKNFQSIEHAELEIDGLTVLTGTNNAGKTAVVRAFNAVFTNPSLSENIVRVGASMAEVNVDLGDVKLGWAKGKERGKSINRYKIDDKTYDNVDRGAIEEIFGYGIRPVECGKEEFWPQIALQQDPVSFLLGRSGSLIAEAVVSDIDRVATLNTILSLAEKDKREAKAEIKIRTEDLKQAESKLAEFDAFRELQLEFQDLTMSQVMSLDKEIKSLEQLSSQHEGLKRQIESLEGLPEIELIREPSMEGLEQVGLLLASLQALKKKLAALDGVDSLSELSVGELDTGELDQIEVILRGLSKLRKDLDDVSKSSSVLEDELRILDEESSELLLQGVCPLCNTELS